MPSARFIAAALAQETAECAVFLVTIEHAAFPAPVRWCTGGEDVNSNGREFVATAMKVTPPGDAPDANGRRGRITVDNTDPENIARLRTATSFPSVTIEVVLADWPHDIELSWPDLELVAQRPHGQAIELEAAYREDNGEMFPYQGFTPHRFPALYDSA